MTAAPRATSPSIVERVGALDWPAITGGLDDVPPATRTRPSPRGPEACCQRAALNVPVIWHSPVSGS